MPAGGLQFLYMSHTVSNQKPLLARIRRIKGQTQALERALEEGQECAVVLQQLAAALACGSQALWVPGPLGTAVHGKLPEPLRRQVLLLPADLSIEEIAETEPMDSALLECDAPQFLRWAQALARRPGPLILPTRCVAGQPVRLERLWHERALSHNTAAAGGNAALMTLE